MGMGRQHKQSILLIYRAEGLFIKKRRKKKALPRLPPTLKKLCYENSLARAKSKIKEKSLWA